MQHVEIRGKKIVYANKDREPFWWLASQNKWEPETFDILDKYIGNDANFIDLGAWISPMSIYASLLGANVYSIEPDIVCLKEGVANQALSGCLSIKNFNIAISNEDGSQMLNSQTPNGLGNSESSLMVRDSLAIEVRVETKRLQTFINEYLKGKDIFIKMDIEGGEALIFPDSHNFLKSHQPTIYFSMHPAFLNPTYVKSIEDVIFDVYEVSNGRGTTFNRQSWNNELTKGNHSFLLTA